MEFHEKLQMLRHSENLTQEELADELFVSRTAISKWESGRGYPSIDSLKAIAKHFNVTIDELIGSEEIVTLAEQDKKDEKRKLTALICGTLDCFTAMLFFLPLFGDHDATSVTIFAMTGVSAWLRIVLISVIALTALNGFCGVVIANFDKPVWDRHRLATGVALSIIGTILFISTRQPYAGIFFFCILIIKGFLLIKSK